MKVEKKIFGQSAPFDVPAGQALLQKTFFWAVNFAALLFVFSYLVVGDSALFDGWTLIIFLLQLLCLQLGLKLLSANAARVFLIIYYFVTLVYVIPRLYQYLIVPHGLTIAYGSGTSINNTQVVAAMVNKALTYQLVGLLVFIVAAAWISGGRHQSDGARPPYGFDRVGFFSSLAALLFTIVARLDEIHYWLYDGWRGWLPISFQEFHALIEIVFNADMVFLVGFLMCFSKSEGLRRDALGVFLLSAVYVAFKIEATLKS